MSDNHQADETAQPALSKARTAFLERAKKRKDLRDSYHRLCWGVVANAGRQSPAARPRWAHVRDATGLGSTAANQLCVDAGFDPEEMVGGAE